MLERMGVYDVEDSAVECGLVVFVFVPVFQVLDALSVRRCGVVAWLIGKLMVK